MEDIKDDKIKLEQAIKALPVNRQEDAIAYYDKHSIDGVVSEIIREAKNGAQRVKDYADRKFYGYGEVQYNINKKVKEFAEEFPELERPFKHLINAYFDFITEASNI